ncbi:YcxB family protein [Asanoa sp. WMMD1127]|uniref:YcxB family protein n=1 Tax=Asanoa sp. WMMD1127 TaxID=3016107 RepID=UPI002416FF67|nr:YcxB family protein [Asanoa sp. WMMD1127]MDG4823613.1 YcxB family protein [Asanoa sp. WMMD1127]
MRIVIVARPDRRRANTAARYAMRWPRRACYALGAVAVLLGLVLAATRPAPTLLEAVLVAAGLLLLICPSLIVAVVRLRHRRSTASAAEYEIDDESLTVRRENAEPTTLRWETVERAAITPDDLLVVWPPGRTFLAVPIAPLSAEHRDELRDLLERRGLVRRARPDLWTTSEPDPR